MYVDSLPTKNTSDVVYPQFFTSGDTFFMYVHWELGIELSCSFARLKCKRVLELPMTCFLKSVGLKKLKVVGDR